MLSIIIGSTDTLVYSSTRVHGYIFQEGELSPNSASKDPLLTAKDGK